MRRSSVPGRRLGSSCHGVVNRHSPVLVSVSVRTIYRDIDTLVAQGASIVGEAGIGFVMRPGFMLPPLMFGDDEIEALVLGSRWVAQRPDAADDAVGHSTVLFVTVDSLDRIEAAVAGAPVVKPRHDTFYGTTELYVTEPGGNLVGFAEFKKS